MIKFSEVRSNPNAVTDLRISLSKLTEKKIKDITGYISKEFGDIAFVISEVILEDDTKFFVEGEHDFPYLTNYSDKPNMDGATLDALYDEKKNS